MDDGNIKVALDKFTADALGVNQVTEVNVSGEKEQGKKRVTKSRAKPDSKANKVQVVSQTTVSEDPVEAMSEVIVTQLKNLKGIMTMLEYKADQLDVPEKIVGAYNIGVCMGIISISANLVGLETQDDLNVSVQGFLDRMKEEDYNGSECEYTPGISPECQTCKSKTLCLLLIQS